MLSNQLRNLKSGAGVPPPPPPFSEEPASPSAHYQKTASPTARVFMALPLITADINRWSVFPAAAAAEAKYGPSKLWLSLYFTRLSWHNDFCFSSDVEANHRTASGERGQPTGRGGPTRASRGIHCYLRKYAEEFKTLIYIHEAFHGCGSCGDLMRLNI